MDKKIIAVLAHSAPVTSFLKDYFRNERDYSARFYRNPKTFARVVADAPPPAVIVESPFLSQLPADLKEIPAVTVIGKEREAGEIEAATQWGAGHYIRSPYYRADLAHTIRAAIRGRSALTKIEGEVRTLESIIELTQWILATLDPKDLLFRIVSKIAEIMPVTRCSIIRVDWMNKSASVVSSFEDPDIVGIEVNLRKYPEIEKALRARKPVLVNNVMADPLMETVRDIIAPLGIRSILVVPIQLESNVIGTLFIRTSMAERPFTEQEVRLLRALADASANVLCNALLFEQIEDEKTRLEKLAITDYLTGIYNVRYFSHRIVEEFSRAQRYALPLSCLMIDIDYFKKINDEYGHKTGDLVLKDFARKLNKHSRKSDVVARYGGEEFVMLLPQTSAEGAETEAERIRRCVRECKFRNLKDGRKLSVSIGIASFPHEKITTHDDLIAMADHALFVAKSEGRNRVFLFR